MSTALVLSNGNLLVNLDENLNVADLFWPHVGEDNQLIWKENEVMIWVDGAYSRITDHSWQRQYNYEDNSLVGKSKLINSDLQLELQFIDIITNKGGNFVRNIEVVNLAGYDRDVRIFFKQNFYIMGDDTGNTAAWYPHAQAVVHYKKHVYLAAGFIEKIYQYSCAGPDDNSGDGAVPDYHNGELWDNAIATGSTQSCISQRIALAANKSTSFTYFISCGKSFAEVSAQIEIVRNVGFEQLQLDVKSRWDQWLSIGGKKSIGIFESQEDNNRCEELYQRSMLLIKSQIDNGGAVIAANDSSFIKQGGKDSYSYFWPRDGAYAILALLNNGHVEEAKNFFRFCADVLSPEGFLYHKYYSNKRHGIASSWLPWVDHKGNPQLPIQQDETAMVIIALAEYIKVTNDHRFLEEIWSTLVVKITHFIFNYRYAKNSQEQDTPLEHNLHGSQLPQPSHDLWEIHWGVHSYTIATVYKALDSIAYLYNLKQFSQIPSQADRIKLLIKEHFISLFWNPHKELFARSIYCDLYDDFCTRSENVDASLFGLLRFEMFDINDERLIKTLDGVEKALSVGTEIGGIGRYENDLYLRIDPNTSGNPWIITTLWMAQYYILKGDRLKAQEYIKWVMNHTDHTGLMAEQIHPHTGYGISMKPLTWSHAEFVYTIDLLKSSIVSE